MSGRIRQRAGTAGGLLSAALLCGCAGGGAPEVGSPWPSGGALACDAPPCTFVFASMALDDRVEIYRPGQEPAYRGAVDFDLDPNPAGDYGEGRLDEPYQPAVAGGGLFVPVGHYPERDAGSFAFLPLALLADLAPGAVLDADRWWAGGTDDAPGRLWPAGAQEAIFTTVVDEGVLVAAVENDFFGAEDTWTNPGALLPVPDPGRARSGPKHPLDGFAEGSCNAAGEIAVLEDGRYAVACDGNEAVAFFGIDGDGIVPGRLCDLPPSSGVRVRHLVGVPGGGAVVAESPAVAAADPARLWWIERDCTVAGVAEIAPGTPGGITGLARVETDVLLASATLGRRGLYPVVVSGDGLAVCPPLEVPTDLWTGADGRDLEPVGIGAAAEGGGLAVGLGPYLPAPDDPGYGKVAWIDLRPADCGVAADRITDLSDGAPGHAPASTPGAPATYRRSPAPLTVVRVYADALTAP